MESGILWELPWAAALPCRTNVAIHTPGHIPLVNKQLAANSRTSAGKFLSISGIASGLGALKLIVPVGTLMSRANRRFHHRRWHPGPSGSQRPPHRNARRVHAQEAESAAGREEGMNQSQFR